jgi:hypothetical protein
MNVPAPEAMSDEELWRFCQRLPGERTLADRLGCIVLPGLALVALAGGFLFLVQLGAVSSGLALPLGLGLFGLIAFYGWVMLVDQLGASRTRLHDAELRRRLLARGLPLEDVRAMLRTLYAERPLEWDELLRREKLKRRYGGSPPAPADEARRVLTGPDAPDWVVLWNGIALPLGPRYWGRVTLTAVAAPAGQVAVRVVPTAWFDPLREPRASLTDVESELDPESAAELLELLRQVDPAELRDVPSPDAEGSRCEIHVFRREPFRQGRVRCNLSDLPEDTARQPGARLAQLILRVAPRGSRSRLTGEFTAPRAPDEGPAEKPG